jgi:hypothetical protein
MMRHGVEIARSVDRTGSGNPLDSVLMRFAESFDTRPGRCFSYSVHFWSASMTYHTADYPGRKLDLLTGYIEVALLIFGCVTGLIVIIL